MIVAFTRMKPAKYWQALLLVLTVCAFCAPRHYFKRYEGRFGHSCCQHGCHKKHGDCPYSQGDADGDDEDEKPAGKK